MIAKRLISIIKFVLISEAFNILIQIICYTRNNGEKWHGHTPPLLSTQNINDALNPQACNEDSWI